MEYNNKNDTQKFFDKYLFNKRKAKYTSIRPHNKNTNIFDNFKMFNNIKKRRIKY
jgi:hypothetical protein